MECKFQTPQVKSKKKRVVVFFALSKCFLKTYQIIDKQQSKNANSKCALWKVQPHTYNYTIL
jgi:hypothetical protein